MTSFLKSYYLSDRDVLADSEIQDWVKEARGPAKVSDFPDRIDSVDALIGLLTQLVKLPLLIYLPTCLLNPREQ